MRIQGAITLLAPQRKKKEIPRCITSFRVDDELDMDLVATIAERNGHPQWEERVQFLKDFRIKRWFYCRRSTIAQIVQQEWIVAG